MRIKNMSPSQIKAELILNHQKQIDIAKKTGVTATQINRVINGSVSDSVRQAIAAAINKDVKEVWPEYYLKNSISPSL